jgi:hypothetical protein
VTCCVLFCEPINSKQREEIFHGRDHCSLIAHRRGGVERQHPSPCLPGQKWPRCVASSLLLWLAILIVGPRHPDVAPLPGQHPHNQVSFVTPSVLDHPSVHPSLWSCGQITLISLTLPVATGRHPPATPTLTKRHSKHVARALFHACTRVSLRGVGSDLLEWRASMHARRAWMYFFPRLWSVCCLLLSCGCFPPLTALLVPHPQRFIWLVTTCRNGVLA